MNSKTNLDGDLVAEWLRVLGGESADAITWAFREHRTHSPYFPTFSEVFGLLREYRGKERDAAEERDKAKYRAEIDQARREGKLVDLAEVTNRIKKIAKGFPEPQATRRLREMRRPETAATTPTLQLTREQIEARKQAEQEEIARCREGSVSQ